jgi:REP element-mobilizing transposase RayT
MKQLSLERPKKRKTEHGGLFSIGKRRSKRPLNMKKSHHVTMRSELARGRRSLLRHRNLIDFILYKASRRFRVRIYEKAICGNHIHLLVKAPTREDLQNFFRVTAGHIAQEILRLYPLQPHEKKVRGGALKNQRKFWGALLYSRIVQWGYDFITVKRYVVQNVLESLGIIPYQPRKKKDLRI